MEKYSCIIIDDEFLARKLLTEYIEKLPQLELLEDFDNALNAIDFLQHHSVDLIFLDIQMPDITGIDFIKSLHRRPSIIFTTAYAEYALQGYELDVTEYLMKPFSLARFMKAVNKATEIIQLRRDVQHQSKPVNEIVLKPEEKKVVEDDFLLIKADRKIHKVYYHEILYIEGALEYVSFHTAEKKILSLYSLKELDEILPVRDFMRIHKSYIVAIHKVNEIDGNQISIGGDKIPLGKRHKTEFLKRFGLEI